MAVACASFFTLMSLVELMYLALLFLTGSIVDCSITKKPIVFVFHTFYIYSQHIFWLFSMKNSYSKLRNLFTMFVQVAFEVWEKCFHIFVINYWGWCLYLDLMASWVFIYYRGYKLLFIGSKHIEGRLIKTYYVPISIVMY